MKISVIITTYNRPLQLKQAFQSVCNQTRKPDEIIIIDDASELNSNIITENFVCEGVTIKIERLKVSKGACYARNRGAAIAGGDILMFLDDDDTWELPKISDQMRIFNENPDVGLVYSGRLMVSDSYRQNVIYKVSSKVSGKIYPQILYSNLIGTTSSVAIKKSIFNQVSGFDENLPALQDYELWIRCCKYTIVEYDNSYNVRYTISDNHTTQISGKPNLYLEAVNKIIIKYSQEIESQGILASRKIRANLFLSVAKSVRSHSVIKAMYWIIKSCLEYPNFIRGIGILIPIKFRQYFSFWN
ncbi:MULTISPECIES: glycosyltransferase family 2 protein [Cyanophyceae]|uniref:glycosyltransferase family 2 protein n=1 Tax=Cyanophyceae TaxID=3028117 RepID=UPI00232D6222|nr:MULTISPECIES: glycosyltransferase family 2 protein [Cyanophyceae]MDB9357226.1 glycosyltransferase [Nodularia spumigena CS-587/03]MDB9318092.1 glycosyltransferase [Nodularia spumigena CS-590/01A]MDB9323338.1 glycosyltransferase [Nodularia spumigena CS-591/07A]MDB9326864.1 glycosyltransferase [Nodularia spumigena CS-590/02]MDB9330742.1 glycosyltransferase [Nodularia spumigena CS-591/04]